jgi:amino acid transporter
VEYLQRTLDWLQAHAGLTLVLFIASIAALVGSLWLGHYYLTTVPHDYFVRKHAPFEKLRTRSPFVWWLVMIVKNLLGVVLILSGLVMFFTPGQGVLTLLLGITLTNFPGKQRLERAILRFPSVSNAVNRIRARNNQPPLILHTADR